MNYDKESPENHIQDKKQPAEPGEAQRTVGYGRPPKATRFKKGRSGNPRGRPRGSRNLAKVMKDILKTKVTVREGHKVKRMTKAEAIMTSTINRAIKGDAAATEGVIQFADKSGQFNEPQASQPRALIILPERCKTNEEWEEKYGYWARGDHLKEVPEKKVTRAVNAERALECITEGRFDTALNYYRWGLPRHLAQLESPVGSEKAKAETWKISRGVLNLSVFLIYPRDFGQIVKILDEFSALFCSSNLSETIRQRIALEFDLLRIAAVLGLGDLDEAKLIFKKRIGSTWYDTKRNVAHPWEKDVQRILPQLPQDRFPESLIDSFLNWCRDQSQDSSSPPPAG